MENRISVFYALVNKIIEALIVQYNIVIKQTLQYGEPFYFLVGFLLNLIPALAVDFLVAFFLAVAFEAFFTGFLAVVFFAGAFFDLSLVTLLKSFIWNIIPNCLIIIKI